MDRIRIYHDRRLTDRERTELSSDQKEIKKRKLTDQERILARQKLEAMEEYPMKTDAESEKSQFDKKCEELANAYFEEELRSLGVPPEKPLESARVHVFSTEGGYRRAAKQRYRKSVGLYHRGHVLIAKKKFEFMHPVERFDTFLHERIHAGSFLVYQVRRDRKGVVREPHPVRIGYYYIPRRDKKYFSAFVGLNEAVTESWASEIIKKHKGDLMKHLGIKYETAAEAVAAPKRGGTFETWETRNDMAYGFERLLLAGIIARVAGAQEVDTQEVWSRFKRGLITGEMMHLRDIEKLYGPGSLKILAQLAHLSNKNDMPPDSGYSRKRYAIADFFSTKDTQEREKIRNLLVPKE